MRPFGKRPARLLAAGSFALAMTACQDHGSSIEQATATRGSWMEWIEKLFKSARGGFGSALAAGVSDVEEEEEWGATG